MQGDCDQQRLLNNHIGFGTETHVSSLANNLSQRDTNVMISRYTSNTPMITLSSHHPTPHPHPQALLSSAPDMFL